MQGEPREPVQIDDEAEGPEGEYTLEDCIDFCQTWTSKEEMIKNRPQDLPPTVWAETLVVFDLCQAHGPDPDVVAAHLPEALAAAQADSLVDKHLPQPSDEIEKDNALKSLPYLQKLKILEDAGFQDSAEYWLKKAGDDVCQALVWATQHCLAQPSSSAHREDPLRPRPCEAEVRPEPSEPNVGPPKDIDTMQTLPMPDEPADLLRAKTLILGDPVPEVPEVDPEVHDSCPPDSVLIEDDTDLDEASEVWEDSQPAPECEGDDWDEVRAVSALCEEPPKGGDDFCRHHDLSHGLALPFDKVEPDTPVGEHVPPSRSQAPCGFLLSTCPFLLAVASQRKYHQCLVTLIIHYSMDR